MYGIRGIGIASSKNLTTWEIGNRVDPTARSSNTTDADADADIDSIINTSRDASGYSFDDACIGRTCGHENVNACTTL